MNSARHSNRSQRPQPDRGRGRGRGGRPQGGFGDSERGTLSYGPVPNIRQVIVGAPVSIVLKVDQPTGRQVQGIVAELLTRGDHPRGIKVRLQDGRVGRVQKMVSEDDAKSASEGLSGLDRYGESATQHTGVVTVTAESMAFTRGRYPDFRADEAEEPQREEVSLADYVVKNKKQNKGSKAKATNDTNESTFSTNIVTCPVCGQFEGDEAAVAHHVDTHFA